MSNTAKKQIDWFKYVGLAVAVVSFFVFQHLAQKSQAARIEALKAQQDADEKERKRREAELAKAQSEDPSKPTKPTELKAAPKESGKEPGKAEDPTPNGAPNGAPKETEKAKPAVEPEKEPDDIQVANEHLRLTFSSRGAGLSSAWLADEFETAQKRKDNKPGLELLGRIDPEQLSLAIPFAKFSTFVNGKPQDLEFTDLEKRVWFLEENSKGFSGTDNVWNVAYSTTLYEPQSPWKPVCKVIKRFKIGETARHIETEVDVANLSGNAGRFQYALRGAAGIFLDGPPADPTQSTSAYIMVKSLLAARRENSDSPELVIVTADSVGKIAEEKRLVGSTSGNLWATVGNRFFVTAMIARQPERVVNIKAEAIKPHTEKTGDERYKVPNQSVILRTVPDRSIEADARISDGYCLFMGPLKEDLLEQYEKELKLEKPIQLGLAVQFCDVFGLRWPNIDRLSWLLMSMFRGLASVAGYGVAVILLTLVIKLALHPFQRKMNISMHKMQALQPKLKAIEEKYAGQTKPELKQKKEMEKWDLMRKEGANPVSGCLPMFIQMPIFFALYGVFSRAFDIRQAHFLWIQDLSLSDRLMPLDFPLLPNQLNLLPLIYIGLSIFQALNQPKPENPDPQQEMSRKMMMFMPVMFGFLFYKMPAGLVLYFAASSIFAFVESWYIKRFILKVDRHGKPLPGSVAPDNAAKAAASAKAGA